MDCPVPRTTTGRGGNGNTEERLDENHAQGNGDGVATSRGARPIDRFQMGGGGQIWLLVCRAEKRQLQGETVQGVKPYSCGKSQSYTLRSKGTFV